MTVDKIKSVIIAIPVLLLGGTEIQTLNLVRALVSGGYKVGVCCYYEYEESMANLMTAAGAEVMLLKLKRSDGLLHLIKKLKSFFGQRMPNIVHVQYLAPGLAPIIAARLARIDNIYATVHIAGSAAYGLKAKLMLRFAASLLNNFFCVSKGVEQFWFGNSETIDPDRPLLRRKHHTIYNSVDIDEITQAAESIDKSILRNSIGIRSNQPVIGIVGRLAFQKGHVLLLDAMKEVLINHPDAVLIAAGKGPDEIALKEHAAKLGIKPSVLWLGEVQQTEAYRLYSIMDVFAMPSIFEGFGLTAAEAMAAGLPVVGTAVEGLTEVVENNITGLLVKPGDSRALASALIELLQDPELAEKMGREGKRRVKRLFSTDRFRTATLYAYEGLSKA